MFITQICLIKSTQRIMGNWQLIYSRIDYVFCTSYLVLYILCVSFVFGTIKARFSRRKALTFGLVALAILLATVLIVWFFAFRIAGTRKGVVVSNGHGCSDIGVSILEKGGSAADAAIATLFCEGVSMPQSMGLGGGFLLTIYERETGDVRSLDARESAPKASNETMFNGDANLSQRGGLAVAVPGELKGYWYLHKQFGYLPWSELVQPTIDLCRNGIYVTPFLANVFLSKVHLIRGDPVLSEIFIDPTTNSTYTEGTHVKRTRLARSLEIIANEGADALYSVNGSLLKGFVEDIQANGGIITVEDMEEYEPIWQEPIKADFLDGSTLYATPLSGSGPVLTLILNILDGFLDLDNLWNVVTFQRIVESFKWGYGKRTELGDEQFNNISDLVKNLTSRSYAEDIRSKIADNATHQDPSFYGAETVPVEDHGTANIVVLAPNGDAIAVTSTINLVLGAGFASESTGIILNDEMDDFSSPNITNSFGLPPSYNNYIEPRKRPLSSMVPSIIVKDRDVVMVAGAAGGSKITTCIASVIVKHLWYNVDLQTAVDEKRLHHQLFPMKIQFEEGFDKEYPELVKNLTDIKHDIYFTPTADGFSAITAITAKGGVLEGAFDKRRGGYIAYLYS